MRGIQLLLLAHSTIKLNYYVKFIKAAKQCQMASLLFCRYGIKPSLSESTI